MLLMNDFSLNGSMTETNRLRRLAPFLRAMRYLMICLCRAGEAWASARMICCCGWSRMRMRSIAVGSVSCFHCAIQDVSGGIRGGAALCPGVGDASLNV